MKCGMYIQKFSYPGLISIAGPEHLALHAHPDLADALGGQLTILALGVNGALKGMDAICRTTVLIMSSTLPASSA